MADAALEYVQSLIRSGKSPTEIKSELSSRGWDSEVIDLYLGKVKSDTIALPHRSKLPLILLLIILLLAFGASGYFIWQKSSNQTTTPLTAAVPQFTASPSAMLAPDSGPMAELKAGFALLFAPPEYGYEATLSVQSSNCETKIIFISRALPDSRYDSMDSITTPGCGESNYHETYRLPNKSLSRTTKTANLVESSTLPPVSDELIKSYLSSPENYTILDAFDTKDGLNVKAKLQSPELTGTYQFTIRPFNHRISQVIFSAAKQTSTGVTNLSGDFIFMNRVLISTPIIDP